MSTLLAAIQTVCARLQIVSDFFWEFPTNFTWYASIPVLGNFSLAIILLVGFGIYATVRLRFIQVRRFRRSFSVLMKRQSGTGITPLASFLLSTAM